MSKISLKIRPATTNEHIYIMEIGGVLDSWTVQLIEEKLNSLVNQKKFKLIVDLKDINYISPVCMGVFMSVREIIRRNKGDIIFINLNDKVYNVFYLLGYIKLYKILNTMDDCLEHFT